jgi:hypothetical protein
MEEKEYIHKAMTGALAEDYNGQWWLLNLQEWEDYVEECGLAYESMR